MAPGWYFLKLWQILTSLFDKHPTDIHLILNKRAVFFNLVPKGRVSGTSFILSLPHLLHWGDSVLCGSCFPPLITGRDLGPFKGKLIKPTASLPGWFCWRGFARVWAVLLITQQWQRGGGECGPGLAWDKVGEGVGTERLIWMWGCWNPSARETWTPTNARSLSIENKSGWRDWPLKTPDLRDFE